VENALDDLLELLSTYAGGETKSAILGAGNPAISS
jgi:hypothetical protein